jgi:modulator of FtsH protease
MNAYSLNGWDTYFTASAGAAAALAGLLFVAVSINLSRILSIPGMSVRAAETFIPVAIVLILSLQALVPERSITLFGWELAILGGVAWLNSSLLEIKALKNRHFVRAGHFVFRFCMNQASTLPLAICGVSLLAKSGGGLGWLVPAVSFCFAGVMANAWILLVAIAH